jgi:outer membrane receptor protein involved in Fe transport
MQPTHHTRIPAIPLAIAAAMALSGLAPRSSAQDVSPQAQAAPAQAPSGPTPAAQAAAPDSPSGSQSPVALGQTVIEGVADQATVLPVRPTDSVGGLDTAYQDVPRSLTEISTAQLQNDVITSYNDFTKYSPSVEANTGAFINYGSPTIRGAISDVYQDGVRTMARQSNEHPFEINAYDSADVVAGPASVIFGPSARTSGYVNFLTKEPYTDANHTTINATLGQWVSGGSGYHQDDNFQVDTGGPLNNALAYRVSYQQENAESFYQYAYDRYQDIFGALLYHPRSGFTLEWTVDYGYFTYNLPGGWNRINQSLLDTGTYLAGAATPIIKGSFSPTGYYSPVYVPGTGFEGNSGSYIERIQGQGGLTYAAGPALSGVPTAGGTVQGWVLNPANVAPVQIQPYQGLTNNHNPPLITKEFQTQLRASKDVSADSTIQNTYFEEFFFNDTATNGGTYNWINDNLIEDRLEYRHRDDFKLIGADVSHDSNTGFSFRFEQVLNYKDSDPAAVTAGGDQFDLTGNPANITRNALFGAQVYPLLYSQRTVTSPYFGPLTLPTASIPNPNDAEFSVTPGGGTTGLSTTTNHTWTQEFGAYSQHSFTIGDHWIYDVGARLTGVFSKIADPLVDPTNPSSVAAGNTVDHISALIPSAESSLSYKPVSRVTLYATYDYVQARNGMTTGSPTWASGADDLTAKAFHSVSELFEEGFKSELIPGKLFWTGDYFHQTRDQSVATVSGNAVLGRALYRGAETSLRYQASRTLAVGANYSYVSANYLNVAVSAEPIVDNNATIFQPNVTEPIGGYWIPEIPRQYLTVYADYTFGSGFGIRPSVTAHSWSIYNYTSAKTFNYLPGAYQANVSLYYNRPKWKVDLDFLNITSQTDFAGNVPLEPFAFQLRFTYRI